MTLQKISSAGTSINSKKLPAIFGKIDWEGILIDFSQKKLRENPSFNGKPVILDYGAGKYTDHIRRFCETRGFIYKAFDPYNGSDWDWDLYVPDVIVCSNVLNVIREDEVINEIHNYITSYNCVYFITTYEGDKTGVGRATKEDCWQRNQKLSSYLTQGEIVKKNIFTRPEFVKFIKKEVREK